MSQLIQAGCLPPYIILSAAFVVECFRATGSQEEAGRGTSMTWATAISSQTVSRAPMTAIAMRILASLLFVGGPDTHGETRRLLPLPEGVGVHRECQGHSQVRATAADEFVLIHPPLRAALGLC